jgi:GT2 family glycosyltransferase
MYLGEADLSERLRNAGYRIVVNTESIAYHSIPSLGMNGLLRNIHIENPTRSYLVARNRKIFMKKHRPKPIFLIYLLVFDPVISFIHMATIIGSKEKKYKGTHLLGAYLRGYLDGMLGRVKFGKKLLECPRTVYESRQ